MVHWTRRLQDATPNDHQLPHLGCPAGWAVIVSLKPKTSSDTCRTAIGVFAYQSRQVDMGRRPAKTMRECGVNGSRVRQAVLPGIPLEKTYVGSILAGVADVAQLV